MKGGNVRGNKNEKGEEKKIGKKNAPKVELNHCDSHHLQV